MTTATDSELRARYLADGVCHVTSYLSANVVASAARGAEDVVAGRYPLGRPPLHRQNAVDDTSGRLHKVAQPHYASSELRALVCDPRIGHLAAALTGAKFVQVWAVDLLVKPPRSARTAGVGWHRDARYMRYWIGEVLTVWIGLADVSLDAGPVTYRLGSHRWTDTEDGDFFAVDDLPESADPGDSQNMWAGVVSAGSVIVHHPRILHASGINRTNATRPALALRLRTERAAPAPGASHPLLSCLDDDAAAPVIHGRRP